MTILYILTGWLTIACIVAAIFCRLVHNAKVRYQIEADYNGEFQA